jgi:hypothetical protein
MMMIFCFVCPKAAAKTKTRRASIMTDALALVDRHPSHHQSQSSAVTIDLI